jgi:hypothetical protein
MIAAFIITTKILANIKGRSALLYQSFNIITTFHSSAFTQRPAKYDPGGCGIQAK